MKTASIAVLSSLLMSLVAAAPISSLVVVTETAVVDQTVLTTTTVYVDDIPSTSGAAASATVSAAQFYEYSKKPSYAAAVSTVSAAPVKPASIASIAAPMPTSTYIQPAPAPTTTSVAPVAPVASVASVAPIVSSAPALVAPAASSSAPVAVPSPVAAQSTTSGTNSGDLTYYDVGMGSCGWTSSSSEDVVAIDYRIMANPANPNNNPKCGKSITISYGGNTHTAKIVDTCAGCNPGGIDVTPELFKKVAPSGDGRVHDVSWSFN